MVAVLAILATITAEGLTGRLVDARRLAERASLDEIASAFRGQVARARSLPAPGGWAGFLASPMGLSPWELATNRSGNARVLLYDPAFRFGMDASPATATADLVQTSLGSTNLASPRVLLVSSTGAALPSLAGVSFDALWTCPDGSVPADWPAWESSGADLRIARMDLRDLFHRVILQNTDLDLSASYAVHAVTDVGSLGPEASMETQLLDGSILYLRLPDGTVQVADALRGETSYVFERGRWNRRVNMGWDGQTGALGTLSDDFVAAGVAPYNRPNWDGALPQSVLDEMHQFLVLYDRWAERGFPGGTGSGADQPDYRMLRESALRLTTFGFDLIRAN